MSGAPRERSSAGETKRQGGKNEESAREVVVRIPNPTSGGKRACFHWLPSSRTLRHSSAIVEILRHKVEVQVNRKVVLRG